jgi:serralysin
MNPLNFSLQSIADAGINLDLSDRDSLKDLVASVSSDMGKNTFTAITEKVQDFAQKENILSSENATPKSTEFSFHRLENLTIPIFSSLAHSPSQTPGLETSTITPNLNKIQPNNNEPDSDIFPGLDPQQIVLTNSTPSVSLALSSLNNTFLLHSNPFATKTIYLDFDGHILAAGSAWANGYNGGNAINAPAWSLDADPTTFNDQERSIIQGIWQRVAEDFAPFDVDVTTEFRGEEYLTRSSSSDQVYGTRALISPIGSYFGGGGIAYVGVFNYVGDNYKPALIFPENLANNEKYIAEAVSHEVGHNLGLNHDGTSTTGYYQGQGSGETGWGTIMGVGYYKPLTQWSKGEYTDANNTEDDLSKITTNSGFGYRSDDAGNTALVASNLGILGTNSANTALSDVNQFGIIEQTTDQDWFKFTTGDGSINLTIQAISQAFINNGGTFSSQYLTPASGITNLDVWAGIYGNDGTTLIAQSNPVDLLSASFTNLFLNAGTYYLAIDGVGKGDPLTTGYSDYGSLGQYSVNGTIVTPESTNNNDLPLVDITTSPSTVVEGLTTSQVYTVTLSAASSQSITIEYATSNGTATSGSDYTSTTGILTFNAGVTTQNITIPILNDAVNESDETFTLVLSNPTNALLGNTTSVATTITDTLTSSVTTVLPNNVENLTLTGSNAVNGTGNAGANVITGNDANNILTGGNGVDVMTGMGGNDVFDLTGIKLAANRSTITDFLTGDTVRLSDNLTTRAGTGNSVFANVARSTSVTLNVSAADVFVFNFDNTETGVDLGSSTTGTALLDGLSNGTGRKTDIAKLSTSSAGGQGYILAYDNSNAYLYYFNAGNKNSTVAANEINLIGIFDSSSAIAVNSLVNTNFAII